MVLSSGRWQVGHRPVATEPEYLLLITLLGRTKKYLERIEMSEEFVCSKYHLRH